MTEKNYRIKEFAGEFTIQIQYTRFTGILWWKKVISTWRNCNIYGNVFVRIEYLPNVLKLESFETLTKARFKIKQFREGVTYHYEHQYKNQE